MQQFLWQVLEGVLGSCSAEANSLIRAAESAEVKEKLFANTKR